MVLIESIDQYDKGRKNMQKLGKWVLPVLLIVLLAGFSSESWAQTGAVADEYNMMDLLVARPIGIAAGIVGTAVFIVTLPFTIPASSVDAAAQMFIVEPFRFSFARPFPDENLMTPER
jgi:hypothetical protein